MNAFQVFDVPAQPLVDAEALKQKLHDFSKKHHSNPNDTGSQQWHQIHEAYQILTDDVGRLKHLLEWNGVEDVNASTAVPEAVMALFSEVGPSLHRADEVINQMDQAESALEKAMLQEDVMSLAMELQQVANRVGEFRFRVMGELETVNASWIEQPEIEQLTALYGQLIYIARWAKQLDEKLFRVMSF